MRTALITGIGGQDGAYLAQFLLRRGYRVIGTVGHSTVGAINSAFLEKLPETVELIEDTSGVQSSLDAILDRHRPEEVYNLAARASSADLWTNPILTGELNGLAVVRILEAIQRVDCNIRFMQASSSEIFGNAIEAPQTELTPLRPRNPYGVAKAYGHWMCAIYRQERGLFACSCILYNHESPLRSPEFVTRKISRAAAMIKLGLANELRLGNLDAKRDWGFAGDYVEAMWLALQHPIAEDYIVATGESHSVREFCEIAFSHLGLKHQDYIIQDPDKYRAADSALLLGDPGKARRNLGWKPRMSFEELVRTMVDADLRLLQTNANLGSASERVTVPNAIDDSPNN